METPSGKTPKAADGKPKGQMGSASAPAAPPHAATIQDLRPASPGVRVLCDMFHQASGLDLYVSCVTPATGAHLEFALSPGARRPRICELVRSTPEGLRRCLASCRSMTERVLENPRMTRQRCHTGLISFHSSATLHGVYPADIHTGCFADRKYSPEELESFAKMAAELRLSRAKAREALLSLAAVEPFQVQNLLNWLDFVANYLSETPAHPRVAAGLEPESESDSEPSAPPPPDMSLDDWIRREISCLVPLPPQNGNRSSGCSEALVNLMADFLCQHIQLPFTTERVAEALGFETSYFCKMFKRYGHESMFKILQRKRLQHACQLLENPFLSVQEISSRVGFSDASYFTRVFRRNFGHTPLEYRKRKM